MGDVTALDREPNWIVRAGVATPLQLQSGTDYHLAMPDLAGFSVQDQPGCTVEQLASAGRFPPPQISVTTMERLVAAGRAAGYDLWKTRTN
jgi:hypothetical protein